MYAVDEQHQSENFLILTVPQEIRSQIIKIIKGENEGYKHVAHKTVFHDLLNSDMPAQEKSVSRLHQEGMSVIVAGTETTKSTLCLATFYILSNPRIRDRLRQALQPVYSDISKPPSLAQLEQIPYLTAIIQECKLCHCRFYATLAFPQLLS